jgi:hypothetical protein
MSDLPRHGSPEDRGSADSYYNRPRCPHYFEGATYQSRKFEKHEMTSAQIAAYYKGYDDNEAFGDKKDWGCE